MGTKDEVRHLGVEFNVIFLCSLKSSVIVRSYSSGQGIYWHDFLFREYFHETRGRQTHTSPLKKNPVALPGMYKNTARAALKKLLDLWQTPLYSFTVYDCFIVFLITQTCLAYSFCSLKKTNIFVWFLNNYRPACDRWRVFMWHLTPCHLHGKIHDMRNKLLFNILQSQISIGSLISKEYWFDCDSKTTLKNVRTPFAMKRKLLNHGRQLCLQ